MYLKDLFSNFSFLSSFINWISQKNINWYWNNYVEYKIISDYDFFYKSMKKRIFPQIPTNLMAMLEGASFSFMIGYKACTWKKNVEVLKIKQENMKNNRTFKMNFSFFQIWCIWEVYKHCNFSILCLHAIIT